MKILDGSMLIFGKGDCFATEAFAYSSISVDEGHLTILKYIMCAPTKKLRWKYLNFWKKDVII